MVITDETDAEAEAKWEHYKDGADHEALALARRSRARADTKSGADTNVRHMVDPKSAVNLNIGLAGRLLRQGGAHAGRDGDRCRAWPACLLTFDEFVSGTEIFGERIQPLMKSRRHVAPDCAPVAKAAE